MIPCCALSATGLVAWVLTTMPSATGSVQEACGFGKPRPLPASGTSTRHCRQAPTGASSGWSQNRGIWTPTCSAARITRVSLGTLTWMPSMVTLTRSVFSGACVGRLASCRHPLSWRRPWTAAGSNGQPPCGRWARYSSRKYWIELEIGLVAPSPRAQNERPRMLSHWSSSRSRSASLPSPLLEPAQRLHQPPGALAARRALAAGLVLVELGPAQHGADHAGGVVEDLQRAGAEHRAGRADRPRSRGVRRGARRSGAGCWSRRASRTSARGRSRIAAGEVDQLAQGDAERRFVLARASRRGPDSEKMP